MDGTVYVGSHDKNIYAIKLPASLEDVTDVGRLPITPPELDPVPGLFIKVSHGCPD